MSVVQQVYRATTGLENARGERVEVGENVPAGFVPDEQIALWLANGDLISAEMQRGGPVDPKSSYIVGEPGPEHIEPQPIAKTTDMTDWPGGGE